MKCALSERKSFKKFSDRQTLTTWFLQLCDVQYAATTGNLHAVLGVGSKHRTRRGGGGNIEGLRLPQFDRNFTKLSTGAWEWVECANLACQQLGRLLEIQCGFFLGDLGGIVGAHIRLQRSGQLPLLQFCQRIDNHLST